MTKEYAPGPGEVDGGFGSAAAGVMPVCDTSSCSWLFLRCSLRRRGFIATGSKADPGDVRLPPAVGEWNRDFSKDR